MAGLAFVALALSLGTKGLSLNAELETKRALKDRGISQCICPLLRFLSSALPHTISIVILAPSDPLFPSADIPSE